MKKFIGWSFLIVMIFGIILNLYMQSYTVAFWMIMTVYFSSLLNASQKLTDRVLKQNQRLLSQMVEGN